MSKSKSATVVDKPATATPRPRRKARLEMPTTKERQAKRTTSGSVSNPSSERQPVSRVPGASEKRLSALDAAALVLDGLSGKAATEGLSPTQLIERMASAKLWISPGGKTPAATLSAAMAREIATKSAASRFRKAGPGRFATNLPSPTRTSKQRDPAKAITTTTPGGEQ